MTKHYTPPTTTQSELESLDNTYYRAIGELIFQWNCVEHALRFAAKRMLGIGIKEARIAMRDPRPMEIFLMIEELALIHQQNLGDWTGFEKKLETGEGNRNILCHARWLDMDGQPAVQYTSGTKKDPKLGSYKRKHYPDPLPITKEWLNAALDNAIDCRQLANGLAEITRQLATVRKVSDPNAP